MGRNPLECELDLSCQTNERRVRIDQDRCTYVLTVAKGRTIGRAKPSMRRVETMAFGVLLYTCLPCIFPQTIRWVNRLEFPR